jgi:putative endonuclease
MRALHIERGKDGELLASSYLARKGFEVELCNWRSGHHEIDLIATKDGIIHFIEVKTRHTTTYGFPEESVNRKKFESLKKAATAFLSRFRDVKKIQFDILSILILPGRDIEFFLVEDVYID